MAGPTPKKPLAFDANVLIDLAQGEPAAWTLKELLAEKGVPVVIPPTVVQELSLLLDHSDKKKSAAALHALECIRPWGFTPFDLRSCGHGITEIFSQALIDKGYLPEEEKNDGYIVAEVALANIPMLVTSDKHLLDIEQDHLTAALIAKDLSVVQVTSPVRILKIMAPVDKRPAKY